jgi:hypothetical protein
MDDRAMLARTDRLTCDSVRITFLPGASEEDRFVMLSAPLKRTWSGDYHFSRADGQYAWGDVAMNFFQSVNPDQPTVTGEPIKNRFTASFGTPGVALPLGRAFNLKVTRTSQNRNLSFAFPQNHTSYTDAQNLLYTGMTRDSSHRFITDGLGAEFNLPVYGDTLTGRLLQVVNPFTAYLNIADFLAGNPATLENAYKVWSGRLNEDAFTVHVDLKYPNGRYVVDNPDITLSSVNEVNAYSQVAPLQSFFVMKRNAAGPAVTSLAMKHAWSTTVKNGQPVTTAGYHLRSGEEAPVEPNLLRVTARQGANVSATVLYYQESAVPDYDGAEDSRKAVYDETPLAIYSLAPDREPLAINTSGDFAGQPVPLGLRIREQGEITFSFAGMENFGHEVTLRDKTLQKSVNIRQTPTYAFTPAKSSMQPVMAINDRFELVMEYTGAGLVGNAMADAPRLIATARDGYVEIQAIPGVITALQIYNPAGALVFSSRATTDYFRIALPRAQIYLIRARVDDEVRTVKVWVE